LIKPAEVQIIRKNLRVKVIDDQTGIALPNAMISLIGSSGTDTLSTNLDGEVVFSQVIAGDYTVSGILNGIKTSVQTLQKENFDSKTIYLSHHDPRFTLTGTVAARNATTPIGAVEVNIIDETQNNVTTVESHANGRFSMQLGP